MIEKVVRNGIDRAKRIQGVVKDLSVGLITNMSGVTKELVPSYVVLNEFCNLKALFSPEHGLYGAAQAGGNKGQCQEQGKQFLHD